MKHPTNAFYRIIGKNHNNCNNNNDDDDNIDGDGTKSLKRVNSKVIFSPIFSFQLISPTRSRHEDPESVTSCYRVTLLCPRLPVVLLGCHTDTGPLVEITRICRESPSFQSSVPDHVLESQHRSYLHGSEQQMGSPCIIKGGLWEEPTRKVSIMGGHCVFRGRVQVGPAQKVGG